MARIEYAQLVDADTAVTVWGDGLSFGVSAVRSDGVNPPETVMEQRVVSLSEAIKLVVVFFAEEWQPVAGMPGIGLRLVDAIQAR